MWMYHNLSAIDGLKKNILKKTVSINDANSLYNIYMHMVRGSIGQIPRSGIVTSVGIHILGFGSTAKKTVSIYE